MITRTSWSSPVFWLVLVLLPCALLGAMVVVFEPPRYDELAAELRRSDDALAADFNARSATGDAAEKLQAFTDLFEWDKRERLNPSLRAHRDGAEHPIDYLLTLNAHQQSDLLQGIELLEPAMLEDILGEAERLFTELDSLAESGVHAVGSAPLQRLQILCYGPIRQHLVRHAMDRGDVQHALHHYRSAAAMLPVLMPRGWHSHLVNARFVYDQMLAMGWDIHGPHDSTPGEQEVVAILTTTQNYLRELHHDFLRHKVSEFLNSDETLTETYHDMVRHRKSLERPSVSLHPLSTRWRFAHFADNAFALPVSQVSYKHLAAFNGIASIVAAEAYHQRTFGIIPPQVENHNRTVWVSSHWMSNIDSLAEVAGIMRIGRVEANASIYMNLPSSWLISNWPYQRPLALARLTRAPEGHMLFVDNFRFMGTYSAAAPDPERQQPALIHLPDLAATLNGLKRAHRLVAEGDRLWVEVRKLDGQAAVWDHQMTADLRAMVIGDATTTMERFHAIRDVRSAALASRRANPVRHDAQTLLKSRFLPLEAIGLRTVHLFSMAEPEDAAGAEAQQ